MVRGRSATSFPAGNDWGGVPRTLPNPMKHKCESENNTPRGHEDCGGLWVPPRSTDPQGAPKTVIPLRKHIKQHQREPCWTNS